MARNVGPAGVVSEFFEGYRTPTKGGSRAELMELYGLLVQIDEAEQRMKDSAFGMWGEVQKSIAGAMGSIISARAELLAAKAEVDSAKVKSLSDLGREIAKLNDIAPAADDAQVAAASAVAGAYGRQVNISDAEKGMVRDQLAGTKLHPVNTPEAAANLILKALEKTDKTPSADTYKVKYREQGDNARLKDTFAREARGQTAHQIKSSLASWETAMSTLPGYKKGTFDNPEVAHILTVQLMGPIDGEVFDSTSEVGQEVEGRRQQALNAVKDIQTEIKRQGFSVNDPLMNRAIENLERVSDILEDPTGKQQEVITAGMDTSGIESTRAFLNDEIAKIKDHQDPYQKAVGELLTVHPGASDVVHNLFGTSFTDIDSALRWVVKDPSQFRAALGAWDDITEGGSKVVTEEKLTAAFRDFSVKAPGVRRGELGVTKHGRDVLEQKFLDGDKYAERVWPAITAQVGFTEETGVDVVESEEDAQKRLAAEQERTQQLRDDADPIGPRREYTTVGVDPETGKKSLQARAYSPDALIEAAGGLEDKGDELEEPEGRLGPAKFVPQGVSDFLEQAGGDEDKKEAVDLLRKQFGISSQAGAASTEPEVFGEYTGAKWNKNPKLRDIDKRAKKRKSLLESLEAGAEREGDGKMIQNPYTRDTPTW